MGKDSASLQQQICQLAKEVARLRKQVRELEAKRDSQEIIIDALVGQTRALKRAAEELPGDGGTAKPRTKRPHTEDKNSEDEGPVLGALPGIESTHDGPEDLDTVLLARERTEEAGEAHPSKSTCSDKGIEVLTRQIKTIFQPKQKSVEFKPNYSYRKFIEYAECSYEFSLMNKKVSRAKNPLKLFIESNLDKVIKYILDNINQLNLNQICSTLFMVNSEIEYRHKLVVMHDCVLEIEQYSRLPYIASALFNNLEPQRDAFSTAVRKVLYHQYCVDRDLFADEEVCDYLELIKHNLSLEKPAVSLWESPSALLADASMFHDVRGARKVRSECIENGFAMRMLCHYLDWDYTYNTFVVEQLFPRLKAEKVAAYAYYLGALAVDAYRTFGRDESVVAILQALLAMMGDSSDVSVSCFLVAKQFYEAEAERWLENNIEALEQRGFTRRDLAEFLLL